MNFFIILVSALVFAPILITVLEIMYIIGRDEIDMDKETICTVVISLSILVAFLYLIHIYSIKDKFQFELLKQCNGNIECVNSINCTYNGYNGYKCK